MAEGIQYPSGVAVDQLVDGPSAVAAQVQLVAEKFPGRLREFIFDAARATGQKHCDHREEPQALPDGLNIAQKIEIASTHDGLCGVFHANAIAEVVTEDVAARGEVTGNRYRNQVRLSPKMSLYYSNNLVLVGKIVKLLLFVQMMTPSSLRVGGRSRSQVKGIISVVALRTEFIRVIRYNQLRYWNCRVCCLCSTLCTAGG